MLIKWLGYLRNLATNLRRCSQTTPVHAGGGDAAGGNKSCKQFKACFWGNSGHWSGVAKCQLMTEMQASILEAPATEAITNWEHPQNFFVIFLAERAIFRIYCRNVGEKKKISRHPPSISGRPAVCTGPIPDFPGKNRINASAAKLLTRHEARPCQAARPLPCYMRVLNGK
jgi:hypothetical protein